MPETQNRAETRRKVRKETNFLAGELHVRAKDVSSGIETSGHVYRRGQEFASHSKALWNCPFATIVTFFQTTEAQARWPVTPAFKKDILRAFTKEASAEFGRSAYGSAPASPRALPAA